MSKLIFIVCIITCVFAMGCDNPKEKHTSIQKNTEYETAEIKHASLKDEYTWLNQFYERYKGNTGDNDTCLFNNIVIQDEEFNVHMTIGQFINKGWYIQEYNRLSEEKYKSKDEVLSGIVTDESDDLKSKSLELLDYLDSTIYDTYRFMMYKPQTQDIIYIIVIKNDGDKWKDSNICGYEYYWDMSKNDNMFCINEITKDTTPKDLDKMLLTSDENIVMAEYDNDNRIDSIYYTTKSAKDGIKIKYNYRRDFSTTEPYEKIVTVSIMN